jgi:hypothetical protein
MAQIIDILSLGGTRDSPFDIVLTTLTRIPLINGLTSVREIRVLKQWWINECKEATKWRQVCRIWRQCHEEHIVVGSRQINAGKLAADATASWEPWSRMDRYRDGQRR